MTKSPLTHGLLFSTLRASPHHFDGCAYIGDRYVTAVFCVQSVKHSMFLGYIEQQAPFFSSDILKAISVK
ncbi:hypothetical protein [Yersinia ruckeri]|uniref:Uncharacterized protein n=1 Tax=Yersinia ruckeri TaxID=29486 RepID=A0A0A8VGX2_YERRU|nr:hypothetical protein [Yersinia ruckeri]EKN3363076.1 hypothetical protein [Yersinia ruckeri]EKN4200568.1 hypothetical protein [Yersinia ruckeri]EKN4727230.1 hypothetical protein [Yersinia ruckeri]ELV7519359.1 hypothetical protein [Yersinia ruckeri]MCK8593866.1 hypothetical protein [Yersinia ruckeri]